MAQCLFPYHTQKNRVHTGQAHFVPVPCGRCPECLKRRTSMWSFRLRKEEERSVSSHFVTLTYDADHIPISPNGFMTLVKGDLQKFFKRLRKSHGKDYCKLNPIRYYACGEYGSRFKRPHYHVILFNSSEDNILASWQAGHVDIGTVSGASVGYTLKYVNKGRFTPLHSNDDRIPEFALMSKRMGANYLSRDVVDFHKRNLDKAFITLEDGVRIPIPRYYKDKMFDESEREQQNRLVKELVLAESPPIEQSDWERHESRRNAIINFKKKYSNRKDL